MRTVELPTLPADLSQATPPDIDAHNAYFDDREARIEQRIESALAEARRAAGEKPHFFGRSRTPYWNSTREEAIATARELAATGPADKPWTMDSAKRAVDKYDEAMCDLWALRRERAPLDAEWARRSYEHLGMTLRGWPRFFLVNNNGGHIHSSQRCTTCHKNGKRTEIGWLPELSGLTEKEAVDKYGPILCTVCYPTAPTEWTIGKPKPAACENAPVAEGTRTRAYGPASTRYGDCTQCAAKRIQITQSGRLRRHKPVTAAE
jgi:hypothetical protein